MQRDLFDHLAAQAMQSLIVVDRRIGDATARQAYDMAEAMILERRKRLPPVHSNVGEVKTRLL